jgi:hypothetical protein
MTFLGDFSTKSDLLTFTIDDHECEAAGKLPADTFVEFVGILGQLGKNSADGDDDKTVGIDDIGDTVKLLADAVRICCTEETAAFITAGMKSATNPIDLDLIQTLLKKLMVAYGMAAEEDENGDEVVKEVADGDRPTRRTPDSATGSAPTAAGSADD